MVPATTSAVTSKLDPRGVVPATSVVMYELDHKVWYLLRHNIVRCELDPRGVVPAKTSVATCELDPRGVVHRC